MFQITDKENNCYLLRKIQSGDAGLLGQYFDGLSDETKSRFGPHPLTKEYAEKICSQNKSSTERYVLLPEFADIFIGYFILEYEIPTQEMDRYGHFGIHLSSHHDVLFAPSVADVYQNKGLSSSVFPLMKDEAQRNGANRIVLMGGTQETNRLARAFYEKQGFKYYGGYQTDMFNHDMMLELFEQSPTPPNGTNRVESREK